MRRGLGWRSIKVATGACAASVLGLAGCGPQIPATDWTCDYDASENRPLVDSDGGAAPDSAVPAADCQTTCGPPVTHCTRTTLEGGVPGAVCPVCTF